MQKLKQVLLTIFILLLPGIGYALMRGIIYIVPLSDNKFINIVLFIVLVTAIGLMIPMWIIKLGVHVASMKNPREADLQFKHIAKDKDQLARTLRKPTSKGETHARYRL